MKFGDVIQKSKYIRRKGLKKHTKDHGYGWIDVKQLFSPDSTILGDNHPDIDRPPPPPLTPMPHSTNDLNVLNILTSYSYMTAPVARERLLTYQDLMADDWEYYKQLRNIPREAI